MKKATILLFLLSVSLSVFSQTKKLNAYKYIIVADKFEFVKTVDQYQTSSLTKFLLKKNGFDVFLSNEDLPVDLRLNSCLALFAEVIDESGMFSIKNKIVLKDCFGVVVYTSDFGKSKEKQYKKGYQEAIRNAHFSMNEIQFSYQPKTEQILEKPLIPETKTVIPEKIEAPEKEEILVKVMPIVTEISSIKKDVQQDVASTKNVLYAQPIKNGFQLVNTTPAVVFQILKTSNKEVFIIKNKNGILFKNESIWTAQYYENSQLIIKKYTINF